LNELPDNNPLPPTFILSTSPAVTGKLAVIDPPSPPTPTLAGVVPVQRASPPLPPVTVAKSVETPFGTVKEA
jgi:hypothetical protein